MTKSSLSELLENVRHFRFNDSRVMFVKLTLSLSCYYWEQSPARPAQNNSAGNENVPLVVNESGEIAWVAGIKRIV